MKPAPGNLAPGNLAPRSFLFLQGLASWFFDRLGRALAARGHAVHRVDFNGGDQLFWRLPGAVAYRGRPRNWPTFLDRLLTERKITDLILFGDSRPLHRAAIPLARARGIRVHAVEEGYLRPGWITFEADGVNANSSLPRDPAWFRAEAERLPALRDAPAVPETFRRRAFEDVAYTLARLGTAPFFPHYRTHRLRHPLVEYAGWLRRLALMRRAGRRADAAIAELTDCGDPVFLFPLQLDGDSQIRLHAPAWATRPAIERVVASFAEHAPRHARLLIKLHPLDDGLVDWARMTREVAAARGVTNRLTIIDGGDIGQILRRITAVATINSTVGMQALARGLPVIALGNALYDLPGLTHRGGLADFWRMPTPPDAELFDAFRRVLAARCMIPGGFFSGAGIRLGVAAAVTRLEAADGLPAWRAGVAAARAFAETGALEFSAPAE
jgi:capsular polysaccharide export protein